MDEKFDTLISVDVCLERMRYGHVAVIDCRFELSQPGWGEGEHRAGHLPGAHYAHLDRDLSSARTPDSGRHPLPDWHVFARCLGSWGAGDETQVIVYDQGSGAYAARLWWLLRAVGHSAVALLDGGWAAWREAGAPVDTVLPSAVPGAVPARIAGGWVSREQVRENLCDENFVLVDARATARFLGDVEPVDPVAGHIPGALNYPFEANLDGSGRFLPAQQLAAGWRHRLDGRPPGQVVHMCGSGVTACHNMLAMEYAGLTGSRLYAGSWSEWVQQADCPVATGPD